MIAYIIIGIALIIIFTTIAAAIRERSIRQFKRFRQDRYIIRSLTQISFDRAVKIVSEIVERTGEYIEIVHDGEVIVIAYFDICEDGEYRPIFWYNKKVLDENGIKH